MLYGRYDGTAVRYNGVDHQFIRDENVLFVYDGERMEAGTIKMIRDQVLVKVSRRGRGRPSPPSSGSMVVSGSAVGGLVVASYGACDPYRRDCLMSRVGRPLLR